MIKTYGESEGISHYLAQLEPLLFQGSRGPGQSEDVLREHGITQILSVTSVSLTPTKSAFRWIMPIDDNLPWPRDHVEFVLAFCDFAYDMNQRALIHCDHGRSRSSGAVILWKMRLDGINKHEAKDWLLANNPNTAIHPGIFDSLPDRISKR